MNIYKSLKKYGNKIAIIDDGVKNITYSELIHISDEMGKIVESKSLVMILCSNNLDCVSGLIGFSKTNNCIMLLSENINQDNLNNLIIQYKPDYIYLPIKSGLQFSNNFRNIYQTGRYKLLEEENKTFKIINKNLSILLPTSGSTGNPKFVRLSNQNFEFNTKSIIKFLKIKPSHRSITTLPINYTYGLSVINTHLFVGASILLTNEKIITKRFWDLLKKYNITSISGVPYIYEVLDKLKIYNMDLPDLKYFNQAGGKLNDNLILKFGKFCQKKNKIFTVMYGQTEATARMSHLPFKFIFKKIGSIGKPLAKCKFEINDNKGRKINKPNKIGELVFYGKNVSLGYAKNLHDLKKKDENLGKLKTGDFAKKDQDGFFYIVGRKDRHVKLYGERINLEDIENEIKKYGYENVCTNKNEKLVIYIKLEKFKSNSKIEEFLISKVSQFLKINSNTIEIANIRKIPRNSQGKIIYKDLEVS